MTPLAKAWGLRAAGWRLPAAFAALLAGAPAPAQGQGDDPGETEASPALPWNATGHFDPVLFMNPASTTHIILHRERPEEPRYVFFPPSAPVLDTELPILAPLASGPAAPDDLAAFVGDPFYPLLGARLIADDLPRSVRAEVVAYREERVLLQGELKAAVASLKEAEPALRAARLADLARLQEARIAELEAKGERLIAEMRPVEVLGIGIPGAENLDGFSRRVRAVRDTPSDAAGLHRESDSLRGAAFFQGGLTARQRSLLLEAAGDLDSLAGAGTGAGPPRRLLEFSPATARVALPAALPQALEASLAAYAEIKAELKDELRNRLWETRDESGDARRDSMAKLAAAEAPRLDRVDSLAEEIRNGLAVLPDPAAPQPGPPLPPEITQRIGEYRRHKLELLKTLRVLLDAPQERPAPRVPPDGDRNTLAWTHETSASTEVQATDLKASVTEFNQRQNELLATLNREEAGIRESVAAFVRSNNGQADRKSVNDLLRDFEKARQRQELWDQYRDYQAAVLMPGLTQGQRNLLFSAALEELSLPLPVGIRSN
jgi:hypothetical protein